MAGSTLKLSVADAPQASLLLRLHTVHRHVRDVHSLNQLFLEKLPITEHSYFCLQVIASAPEGSWVTIRDLAHSLKLGSSTTTELVNRLCARGWAERMEVDGDRRRVGVSLTDDGKSFLKSLLRAHEASIERHRTELLALAASISQLVARQS